MIDVDSVSRPIIPGHRQSIREMLENQAERTPDAVAIAALGRRSLTYGVLWNHIVGMVKTLNGMGVGRGDRVAIVLPNGPEMAVAFLAVASAATSAPLNPAYRAEEFDFYLADLNAKALLVQSGIDSPAIAVARQRGIAIIECTPLLDAEAGLFSLSGDMPLSGTQKDHTFVPGLAEPNDVALVLHTSGTTSRPKIVPLSQMNICTSACNIQNTLALTGKDRCLNVMPLFHIHGLIGATLSSLAAGASVVCTPGMEVGSFFRWLEEFRPTWYTAVPTMHQAIVTRADSNLEIVAGSALRLIRSSSSALPPQVMAELERVFQVPVIEAYGMTEAAHQMASNPLPPRSRKPGSVGIAAGPEVATMDQEGNILPQGEKGEVVIRGANVTNGYENNPAGNGAAFTNGWFRTGDQGFLDAEGYLFLTGRLKEIINRGGEKISPREVDEVILDHPAIAQVVTFAVPHVSLGEEVAAAVVLKAGVAATEREVQEFASSRLAPFKVPRRVIILKEIPKGPTGKLQRIGLAEKLNLTLDAGQPEREKTFLAPRNPLEVQLAEIWEKVLAVKPVGVRDNFFDLGGYSLLAVDLVLEIERAIGADLPPSFLLEARTVEQMAEMLRDRKGPSPWSPLVAIQPNGSEPPFFFIHAVSGNVLNYRALADHLGPDQPFYGLQAQGLDGKTAPLTRVEDMAALYIKEILTVQPDGPYFLGGGSSGGIVAFEMARQLQAQGKQVGVLALFDTYCPKGIKHQPRLASVIQKVDRFIGKLLLRAPKDQLRYVIEMTAGKSRKAFEGFVLKMRGDRKGSLSRGMPEVLKANRQAMINYAPEEYSGRITLFLSCEAPERSFYDSRLGWNDRAGAGLELHVVPGSHDTLFAEPHVNVVAEKLRSCLQRTPADSTVRQVTSRVRAG